MLRERSTRGRHQPLFSDLNARESMRRRLHQRVRERSDAEHGFESVLARISRSRKLVGSLPRGLPTLIAESVTLVRITSDPSRDPIRDYSRPTNDEQGAFAEASPAFPAA